MRAIRTLRSKLVTPQELSDIIRAVLVDLQANGLLPVTAEIPAAIKVERPKNREHGDWATTVAMQLARSAHRNPRELAETIAQQLQHQAGITEASVAGPGFVNLRVDAAAAASILSDIVAAGSAYGQNDRLARRSINLEFVSANPTGPLHIGHTRWAALGDSIGRLLKASGANVAEEYYINDAGAQMDRFGYSVLAAARGEATPEGGYPGAYIQDLGKIALAERPEIATLPPEQAMPIAREIGYRIQLGEIQESLRRFNVHFDVWFSERTLHAPDASTGLSAIDRALERLREQGNVYEKDDATWVRTTRFGDDKDRVFVRANDVPTYFAADAAYYLSKRERGFAELIYLLGADHHGYVGRLKALAAAAGDDPEKTLTVLIGQLVNLNGAKLSKRAGNIIELNDLLDWIGADALRYWLARFPADSPLSLDGEALRSQTSDNPVFYVQYAHARTANVSRNAQAAGITRDVFEPSTLTHPTEEALIARLGQFTEIVGFAAELREPHRVARYLEQLAGDFHRWYDTCRVIPLSNGPVEDVHRTRLWLNDATGQVLRNGLSLLGVSAPERM